MELSRGTRVEAIYVGGLAVLQPEGQSTGIFKRPVAGPVRVGREGISGDRQADRRVHGGPEKALHHYAADNYPLLAAAFPELESQFVAGSLGENLSSRGLTEDAVCVGDVFRLGGARIQVSQPRSPCWKIDHKFGVTGLTRFIADHGLAGWYYRVLETGAIRAGDVLELVERNPDPISLRRLWQAHLAHRPEADELAACASTPGLTPGWVKKLSERLDWLRREAGPRPEETP